MTSSINVFGAETDERGGKEYIEQALEESGLSFEEIEKALENSSLQDTLSFDEIIRKLWNGETGEVLDRLGNMIKDSLFFELSQNRKNFAQIILLAVFAALITNLSSSMFSSSLQETGFFVTYLSMTGIVLRSFSLMLSVTKDAIYQVFDFMEVFIPSYAIAITMVSGSVSSFAIYELVFLLIKGCQWLLKNVILPLIEAYMMIGVINCVGETDRFSHMGNLMKEITERLLKWGTGIVLSLNLIQNMILPAVDSVKSTLWQKGLSAIPGAGNLLSALTGSILGASVLIKNSIGVGCLIILILLCAVPVIKLIVFVLSFSCCSAFLQPISDKRLTGLLHVTGESGKLLVQTMIACLTLFFITIALAAISTNMRYYAG
jgi:stage III sporulation protein AE